MISPRLGADTSSPTDMTDDASDSVGDMSITSKDSECQKYPRSRKSRRKLVSSFRRSFKGPRSLSSHGVTSDDHHLSPHTRLRSASENRGAELQICGALGGRGLSNADDGS